ncbi:hypothetical protein KVR01_011335 [Diaporthe batatas]|uniref:uncharacterized protein n=1 Tax=Diaporthe batatas TaxID=748121 RepID=UPI001D044558|nr:uncharacterized protein KVR01_011335 [Diaporthe batatas]KAG8158892.1 hypothetical protein KVR01_011335 [Diaporthe batatas]
MAKPKAISHPRRILAVSLEGSTEHLTRVIKDLTGASPEPASAATSLAGTTHDLTLKTAYYTATVPIWLDLITTAPEWADSFLSPEAREVLEVLGGVVVVFPVSSSSPQQHRDLIREVGRVVREGLGGWEWDGVGLGVGVGEVPHLDDLDMWDEACGDAGLEFVHVDSSATPEGAKNEFGEKMGIPRVLEALESNEWDSFAADDGDDELAALGDVTKQGALDGDDDDDDDDGADLDPENLDFGFDREDFEGLKKAIWEARAEREGDDGDSQGIGSKPGGPDPAASAQALATDEAGGELGDEDIQKVERMMRKLQAVKDMSAGLPEDQKKRMAAKAVGEVMRDL